MDPILKKLYFLFFFHVVNDTTSESEVSVLSHGSLRIDFTTVLKNVSKNKEPLSPNM